MVSQVAMISGECDVQFPHEVDLYVVLQLTHHLTDCNRYVILFVSSLEYLLPHVNPRDSIPFYRASFSLKRQNILSIYTSHPKGPTGIVGTNCWHKSRKRQKIAEIKESQTKAHLIPPFPPNVNVE